MVVFSMVPVLVSDLEVCITVAVLLPLWNVDETANLTLSSYLECQSLNCFLQMKAMVELIVNLIDSYSIVVLGMVINVFVVIMRKTEEAVMLLVQVDELKG